MSEPVRALAVAAPPSKSLPSMTDGRTGGREERETAQSNVTIQNVNQSSLRISNRERILERERERERKDSWAVNGTKESRSTVNFPPPRNITSSSSI